MSDDRAARTVDSAPWDEPRDPHAPDILQRSLLLAVAAGLPPLEPSPEVADD